MWVVVCCMLIIPYAACWAGLGGSRLNRFWLRDCQPDMARAVCAYRMLGYRMVRTSAGFRVRHASCCGCMGPGQIGAITMAQDMLVFVLHTA